MPLKSKPRSRIIRTIRKRRVISPERLSQETRGFCFEGVWSGGADPTNPRPRPWPWRIPTPNSLSQDWGWTGRWTPQQKFANGMGSQVEVISIMRCGQQRLFWVCEAVEAPTDCLIGEYIGVCNLSVLVCLWSLGSSTFRCARVTLVTRVLVWQGWSQNWSPDPMVRVSNFRSVFHSKGQLFQSPENRLCFGGGQQLLSSS